MSALSLPRPLRNTSVQVGGAMVLVILALGMVAPLLAPIDPTTLDPVLRNKVPGTVATLRGGGEVTFHMGTDGLGRDVFSRVLYGARSSMIVGATVAALSVAIGAALGIAAGVFRWLDAVVMRLMDGLMAIPAILLAIALVSLFEAGIWTVILAITVAEVPRVVRLVRSVVLTVRNEPYVEAARTLGTPMPLLIWRHIVPNTLAPLIVQGTFICASAILVEAILSFLGVGIPPETPTWGNIIAEGRQLFRLYPHNITYPGLFLAATVLAVNMMGDGLRDMLDPKLARRI